MLTSPPQASSPDRQPMQLQRRRFLHIAAGSMLGVAAVAEATRQLGFWHQADLGIGKLAELERNLLEKREKFAAEYLKDPEAEIDMEEAMRLFVRTELARYMRKHPAQDDVNPSTFERDIYRPFMDDVAGMYKERSKNGESVEDPDTKTYDTPTVTRIANAKLALYERIGDTPHYWGRKNNIVDVLTSQDLQCRSGSRMLLLTLLENVAEDLQPGEKLVTIETNHHMQTGLLTKEGRVIAFEMTKSGKGIQDLGLLADIKTPIQITDARHELAQAAMNKRAHHEQTILLENIPEQYTKFDKAFDVRKPFGGGGLRLPNLRFGQGGGMEATTDQYGFGDGKVDIPQERIPITPLDYVPSTFTTSREDGEGNSIYDTVRDAEKTHAGLWASMNAEERKTLMEFEQHSPIFSRHMNGIKHSYTLILSDRRGVDVKAEVQTIIVHTKALEQYMDQNDLDLKYQAYERALEQYHKRTGKNISYPRNPMDYAVGVLRHLQELGR